MWGPSAAPLSKRIYQMTRILPGVIAMATIVVASNILVQFLILDGLLTWGAFTYPLAFLVTDVMNRVYGPSAARKVVFSGQSEEPVLRCFHPNQSAEHACESQRQ